MRLYSWNVNGFRAIVKKGFWNWFNQVNAELVCLQETKVDHRQLEANSIVVEGYKQIWNSARKKKGYSGVAVIFKQEPLNFILGLPDPSLQGEGRLIQFEFEGFYLLNVYFPNGQMSEERLDFKLQYYDSFLNYIQKLQEQKPIVICGDFNTAHKEIDLAHPQANSGRSGFLPIEREWMDRLVDSGFIDTFRLFNQSPGQYTWWDYRSRARKRNVGWRIDYFFVSPDLVEKVRNAWIESEVMGSDHCPIGLELED